jgi:hypothetical protein
MAGNELVSQHINHIEDHDELTPEPQIEILIYLGRRETILPKRSSTGSLSRGVN